MKYLFASVIIAGLLCVACSHRNDVVVASVYDETLTMSDLQDQFGVATCCGCCSDLAASFLNTGTSAQTTVTAGINIQA